QAQAPHAGRADPERQVRRRLAEGAPVRQADLAVPWVEVGPHQRGARPVPVARRRRAYPLAWRSRAFCAARRLLQEKMPGLRASSLNFACASFLSASLAFLPRRVPNASAASERASHFFAWVIASSFVSARRLPSAGCSPFCTRSAVWRTMCFKSSVKLVSDMWNPSFRRSMFDGGVSHPATVRPQGARVGRAPLPRLHLRTPLVVGARGG